MDIVWSSNARDDDTHWVSSEPEIAEKIDEMLKDIRRRPFTGLGKPEPLRGNLAGWWSRRISGEPRLVYRVAGKRGQDQRVEFAQCRYHY